MPVPARFRTARLAAERMRPEHLSELCAMHADPAVMATLGGVRPDAVTAAYLAGICAHWERHGFGYWLFRDAAGRFAGRGGLRRVAIDGVEEVELAYALMPEFWGRGLAGEIAEAALRLAFGELALPDVVAFTLPDNHRSRRVMEKAGFAFERAIVYKDLPHVLYRRRATGSGPLAANKGRGHDPSPNCGTVQRDPRQV